MRPPGGTAPNGAAGVYPHVLGLVAPVVLERAAGVRYVALTDWLRDWWSWSEPDRERWRRARLEEVLDHAARHVPFYREVLGRRPVSSIELSDLPIVDKRLLRRKGDAARSEGWRRMPHVEKETGGSTGDPWRYQVDRIAWAHVYAGNLHFWGRLGYRYGERVVRLGTPHALGMGRRGWKGSLRVWLERHDVSQTGFHVDEATSRARVVGAGRRPSAIWYGYPSVIAGMANAVLEDELSVHLPRAIVTTAETLEPGQRERIEAAFGKRLWDQYGCNDGGVLAQECEQGRYHLAEHLSIVEILEDGVPCPPGAEGDVVVTNLHARVLPFLRYRVGDRAVRGEGPCPCGRAGETLERVAGRRGAVVRLPDGTELSLMTFVSIFRHVPAVRRWQVVHSGSDVLKVRYEAGEDFDPSRLERHLRDVCGQSARIVLTPHEPIVSSPQGKHLVVVREPDGTGHQDEPPGLSAAGRSSEL